MSYYNTNKESGDELNKSRKQTEKQEDIILKFFQDRPKREMGPSSILIEVGLKNVPITSIRRAITNLTTAGFLVKTENTVIGAYGKAEHLWKFKGPKPEKFRETLFKV